MKIIALIVLFNGLFSGVVFAEVPYVEVNDQIEHVNAALEEENAGGKTASLNQIRVRTTMEAGVQIPAITSLSINPELELFFVKK